jgi:hypothetical protein
MRKANSNRALLETTKEELNFLVSCILQIDIEGATAYASHAATLVTAKMAGAGVSAGLVGLVSTFGTASTGAAIAGLSGAAEATATMYWIGSWVGGGVAWGSAIVAGIPFVIALVALPFLKSKPRKEDSFAPIDAALVNTSLALIAQIDAELAKNAEPSTAEMVQFYRSVITPFYEVLQTNLDDIASRLDSSNAFALQVQADPRFKRKVVDQFAALDRLSSEGGA